MHIKPKKRLGQNFLVDKNMQRKMAAACGLAPSDTVLEIGAGRGELTESLAKTAKEVYALEIDPSLCVLLKEKFGATGNVRIISRDILKFDIGRHFSGSGAKIKVVGNIPYYISSPIIEHLFKYKSAVSEIFITVQKEFADRVVAKPGSSDYSSLSVFVQYHTEPRMLFTVNKGCFYPKPKVDSAFLKLSVRGIRQSPPRDEGYFFKVVRSAFGKRRKTLRNSLNGVVSKEKLDIFFKSYKIKPDVRPQELSPQNFIDLANL